LAHRWKCGAGKKQEGTKDNAADHVSSIIRWHKKEENGDFAVLCGKDYG
jgi:hypothetical protein